MFDLFILALTGAAMLGMGLGAVCHHGWRARTARRRRRIPVNWHLQPRPLLSVSEQEVWRWLKTAFFDHHVMVKVPVIRYVAPRNSKEGQRSYELLNGVYCTFTVCAVDGSVIGCVDLPGQQGLKASNRDLKQKLFAQCGIAYAVVRASNLPSLEAVRAAFLGEIDLSVDDPESFGEVPSAISRPTVPSAEHDSRPTEPGALPVSDIAPLEDQWPAHMSAMAQARSSLQAKLERNRKIRFTNFDPLSTSTGIVQDNAGDEFAVQWEDSFIGAEESDSKMPGATA
jgi:hypothetical protein